MLRIAAHAAAAPTAAGADAAALPPWVSSPPPAATATGDADGEIVGYLQAAASLISARVRDLADDAARTRPAWLTALGTPPADPARREQRLRHIGIITAYRDQYQVTTSDPRQVLGPYAEPGHAGHTAYWHAAAYVLTARALAGLERPRAASDGVRDQVRRHLPRPA